jgi:hypothetical protein
MKKYLFLLLAGTFSVAAQTTKNVGDFDEVKVFDRINVELVPSGENKVEISGTRASDVEVVNKNGELKIRMKINRLLDGENVKVVVHYKTLEGIDASEGAIVSSSSMVRGSDLEITAKEGATIELGLDVRKADVKSVTGGIIRLNGKADEIEASLGTGGILEAKSLTALRADVSINAGGEAEVHASEAVDAKVRAGGDIKVYGNPKHVEQKTTLGGNIDIVK